MEPKPPRVGGKWRALGAAQRLATDGTARTTHETQHTAACWAVAADGTNPQGMAGCSTGGGGGAKTNRRKITSVIPYRA